MSHRSSALVAALVLMLGLAACSGGSGGSPAPTTQTPVTQSTITLPSSVQVVSAK
jgi:ABC-type glycerol-3-phosphate transport system substrate-binding protein